MAQYEITAKHPLLDEKGHLIETGYTKGLLLDYSRKAIKGGKLRIKEWDYYCVNTQDFAICLTIADNSYMSLDSISLLDFSTGFQHTNSPMGVLTLGKRNLPPSSAEGSVETGNKKYYIQFKHEGHRRVLHFHMDKFFKNTSISGEIVLENPPQESMVIVTPFPEKDTAFYYNQKINCLPASGRVKFGDKEYIFEKGEAFGVLDWGRGVWTYENTWYWGSASGQIDGAPIGWNIGYGFGDTSAASENMVFYKGKAHKLSEVTFNIPMTKDKKGNLTEDYLKPWTFTSDDGRFEMDFEPLMDRASCTDVGVICSDQHQVFGKYTGKVVLDDGNVIEIKDLLGFAEKVHNKW